MYLHIIKNNFLFNRLLSANIAFSLFTFVSGDYSDGKEERFSDVAQRRSAQSNQFFALNFNVDSSLYTTRHTVDVVSRREYLKGISGLYHCIQTSKPIAFVL